MLADYNVAILLNMGFPDEGAYGRLLSCQSLFWVQINIAIKLLHSKREVRDQDLEITKLGIFDSFSAGRKRDKSRSQKLSVLCPILYHLSYTTSALPCQNLH